MKKIVYDVEGISDVGTTKTINQDRYVYKVCDINGQITGLFAVADGVGGLSKGEVASAIAISSLNKWWDVKFRNIYSDKNEIELSLRKLFQKINLELIENGKVNDFKMGTTLSVMITTEKYGIICHIGDSRIYRIKKKMLVTSVEQLTKDHSKDIEYKKGDDTVIKSVLTQCLGIKESIECYTDIIELHKSDRYIVCSDGIYKQQDIKQIKEIVLASTHSIDICSNLINNAKSLGETDNITIVGIDIKEM